MKLRLKSARLHDPEACSSVTFFFSIRIKKQDEDQGTQTEVQTLIFWKTDCEGRLLDLVLEQVLLVQEENDGGVGEPLVVTDRVEQLHALHHSILQIHNMPF